jgi:hypothetical protein
MPDSLSDMNISQLDRFDFAVDLQSPNKYRYIYSTNSLVTGITSLQTTEEAQTPEKFGFQNYYEKAAFL